MISSTRRVWPNASAGGSPPSGMTGAVPATTTRWPSTTTRENPITGSNGEPDAISRRGTSSLLLVEDPLHRSTGPPRDPPVLLHERLPRILPDPEPPRERELLLRRGGDRLGVDAAVDLERVLDVRQGHERLGQGEWRSVLDEPQAREPLDRVERPLGPDLGGLAAEPH